MTKFINRLSILALLLWMASGVIEAQEPAGYYKSAEGLKQKALLQKLCTIVGPHTNVGYDGLWNVYEDSDVRPGTNYYWDMYSTANFPLGQKKCGNYKNIGDCVNREHSFPKSWFSNGSPMVADGFHIYPTDGKVNGQRSNNPFGECANGTRLPSHNGVDALGKLGASTFPGYSGVVFEPDDEYKGDFARTYFYMAACYNDKIAGWSSPMLAKNNYPCYTSWAINLLMKWNAQDPVSKKEIDRNNAVYKHQRNRNPFIDHPELADYIWGDKQNSGWVPGGVIDPKILQPYNNSTVDLGISAAGKTLSQTITVKAEGLTKDLAVSVSGTGFSVSPATVSAASANQGTTVTVKYVSATPADATGKLTLSSAEATASANLKAKVVDGIPALPATDISTDSFTANWIDINQDGGNYTLSVFFEDGTTLLPGYPKAIAAAAQKYKVTGLDYEATYKYSLGNTAGKTSNTVTVRTASPERDITFELPDGGLNFTSLPNTASEPLAVTVYSEYIEESTITVAITGGFQISTDKTNWKTSFDIDTKDTEEVGVRFYVRMPALNAGSYDGTLSASTPTVEGADIDVFGVVAAPVNFFEDFEAASSISSYDGGEYTGTASKWKFTAAGLFGRAGQDRFNGSQAVCTGKTGNAEVAMSEDKRDGAGSISFLAAPFSADADAVVELHYSVNGGSTWTLLKSFAITEKALTECSATLDVAQPVRFKFVQTDGKRLNIDDVKITAYTQSGVEDITEDTSWDAYCANGIVRIEVSEPANIKIYTTDARQVYGKEIGGNTSVSLPAGYYIVVKGNDSRKVIVK